MTTSPRPPLFGFGPRGEAQRATETLQAAARADEVGLDLFSVSDHPYLGHRLDTFSALGVTLGATQRISVFGNVANLPLRYAPMLARTATSLSELSGGRYIHGIGAGGMWDKITTLGVPRLTPGAAVRALRESLVLLRSLSGGGDPVTFDGEFYQVSELEPADTTSPKVWTGSGGKKSLAVTAELADGWLPPGGADWLTQSYLDGLSTIRTAAAAANRDLAEFDVIFNVFGDITTTDQPATRDADGRWVGGSVAQWVEELTGAVLEHGAAGFVLSVYDNGDFGPALGPWAQEIAPAVREAVATG